MLHIVLVILKIIGILLAVILGLVLFVVLAVLFCPVRYRCRIHYADKPQADAVISFLGPLIRLKIMYDEEISTRLRILGIPIRRKKNDIPDDEDDVMAEEPELVMLNHEENAKACEENPDAVREERTDDAQADDTVPVPYENRKKPSGTKRSTIRGVWNRFKRKLSAVKKSAAGAKQFIHSIGDFREDERIRAALSKCRYELFRLIGRLKPSYIKGNVEFGFDDPSLTGKMLGLVAVIKSMWCTQVQVLPDFEQKMFRTNLQIKGKIRGIWFVAPGIRLYFNNDIRYMIKCAKRLRRKSNG